MPQLILYSFLIFAVWLIRRDIANRPGVSSAIWIPTLWLGILASRPVSAWTGFGGGIDTMDGSPVDRMFYLAMILASMVVLSRRGINWAGLLTRSWPLFLFYGFLLVSVFWANSPYVSFKRWFKESGNILVALVILTEVNPLQAFRAVFVRCAYVLVPLSIIFVRYFPDIGRRYNARSGAMEVIGATFQKNALGTMVLVCGIVFVWDWIERSRSGEMTHRKLDRYLTLFMGVTSLYLMNLSDSKTSMLALILACLIIVTIRFPNLHQRVSRLGIYLLAAAVGFFLLDRTIGIVEGIVTSLGRDMTFTGRTEVWRVLRNIGTDPILGTGFMSFWDDPFFQSKLPYWVAASAHNGYLDIYLAGGAVGIFFLSIMILGVGSQINRSLAAGSNYSVVRFGILVATLVANFSESNFTCMTPLGFLFILAAIGHVRPEYNPEPAADAIRDGSLSWTLPPLEPPESRNSQPQA